MPRVTLHNCELAWNRLTASLATLRRIAVDHSIWMKSSRRAAPYSITEEIDVSLTDRCSAQFDRGDWMRGQECYRNGRVEPGYREDDWVSALVIGSGPEPYEGGGFRDALPIELDRAYDGVIDRAKLVHVFRIDGAAGQKIQAEVLAGRRGSCLDSLLTAYDGQGHTLAVNDDFAGSTDSQLTLNMPADGPIFLTVIDAYDQGSPEHVYRLIVRTAR